MEGGYTGKENEGEENWYTFWEDVEDQKNNYCWRIKGSTFIFLKNLLKTPGPKK